MIWQAVVNYMREGQKHRHLVLVETDTIDQALAQLEQQYGPECVDVAPRPMPEIP